MTPKQLLTHYGTAKDAAYALGYTIQAVGYWIENNRIPYRAQQIIEQHTGKKLVARKPIAKPIAKTVVKKDK